MAGASVSKMLVGSHEARFVAPDVIYAIFRGDVSPEDARQLSELFAEWTHGIDCRFILDLRELGYIGPDARDQFVVQRQPQLTDRDYRVELGFIGANLRTKVLTTVVMTARSIASNVKVRTQYFADLDEAIVWAKMDPARLA
jgi:hypothetical protein